MVSPKLQLPQTLILIDSREQLPWDFITPVTFGALPYGDYSVAGLEHLIAIERKSFPISWGALRRDARGSRLNSNALVASTGFL